MNGAGQFAEMLLCDFLMDEFFFIHWLIFDINFLYEYWKKKLQK